ncbi:FAD binding domain-containing protein [Jeotgalibacillus soli]|uniref:FAD-binding PCMH-type domain-containing protein n=1 Tax=Jeotgalibacillus soli TaxID=889306 RepID=A0A0C2VMC2_9BACL|nr:FAD binding domain-containing protein [Jeotgalibacillus soli]KIL45158.1 hypothetical protein KP78_27020 [Jeotgalibacillus soli]
MISFDFDYYKPDSIDEAVTLFRSLSSMGKKPMYYAGGTEIITLGRLNLLYTNAVIDLKGISECNILAHNSDTLTIGASLTLAQLGMNHYFPLLANISKEIADHTSRLKITVGGNICGNIFYREAVLPFLLTDSQVLIAGKNGLQKNPINNVFCKTMQLENGEFIVQLQTQSKYIESPFVSIKRRQQWNVGYPLITVNSIKVENQIRVAIAGLCPFPFRSLKMESMLNRKELSTEEKVELAIQHLPQPILNDVEGSDEYRIFVLKNTLLDVVETLEGAGA